MNPAAAPVAADIPDRPLVAAPARQAHGLACPDTSGRHMVEPEDLIRVREQGGTVECMWCRIELRYLERERLEVALGLIDLARDWAGLSRLNTLQRKFLHAILSVEDPLVGSMDELGLIFVEAIDRLDDPLE